MFDIILYQVGRIWFELLSSSPSQNRPAQLVELPRNKFDQELFPHSACACSDFCDICDNSAIFNILRQNVSIFDIGNG